MDRCIPCWFLWPDEHGSAWGYPRSGACTALLLCYFRLMRRMVEQPDILPQTRFVSWSPPFGNSLTGAITRFSMRTLLRSRQHRMILSFYLGIGITIVVGYVKATNRGLGSTTGNDQQFVPVCQHSDDGPDCPGIARGCFHSYFAFGELDYSRHASTICQGLPQGNPLVVADSGGGACHGQHCRLPAGRLSVASGAGAFLCDVLVGNPAGGECVCTHFPRYRSPALICPAKREFILPFGSASCFSYVCCTKQPSWRGGYCLVS